MRLQLAVPDNLGLARKPVAQAGGLFSLRISVIKHSVVRIGLLFSTTEPYATIG
jgi:hypothetical protein